jgi:hypothetical protein
MPATTAPCCDSLPARIDVLDTAATEPFLLARDCAAPVVMTVLTIAKRTLHARIVDKIAR